MNLIFRRYSFGAINCETWFRVEQRISKFQNSLFYISRCLFDAIIYSELICVVAMAIERFILVCMPHRAKRILSKRNRIILGSVLTLLSFALPGSFSQFLLLRPAINMQSFVAQNTGVHYSNGTLMNLSSCKLEKSISKFDYFRFGKFCSYGNFCKLRASMSRLNLVIGNATPNLSRPVKS